MSSADSSHHNQQQQMHNRYDFHNGLMQNREHQNERSNNEQIDSRDAMLSDALIRGNMQYVNGELKKIPRPLNAFMIFSNEKRKELKKEFPGEPNNMISSRLGAAWKELVDETRKKYHDMAHREDLEHRRKYPNYQYCPGHARKLKKARREQRLRQQGLYRTAKQQQPRQNTNMPQSCASNSRPKRPEIVTQAHRMQRPAVITKQEHGNRPIVKREAGIGYSPSSSVTRTPAQGQIVHGIMNHPSSAASVPGPHGEGRLPPSTSYMSQPGGSSDCMMSCCKGCTPENIYCCPDSHWSSDALAAQHGFPPAAFPPPMFYFAPGYDPQYASDGMLPQHCLVPNDCGGCFPSPGFMDACYGPVYSGGDGNVCFMPTDLSMTTPPPNPPTPLTSVGAMTVPVNDDETELTDISNNMVPSVGRDSQETSQRSCGSKGSYSVSPSTLQEISPPVALNLSTDKSPENLN